METKKDIVFPEKYSYANALKSAYLVLQETKDKNKKPVLEICTRASIANSLFDMCIQGLSPAKKQCYFICYGNTLSLQRSYFGDMAVMKRLNGVKSINANIIYEKDKFSIGIDDDGSKTIKHDTDIKNIGTKIVGAYCIINFDDGNKHVEIMNIEQIHNSWNQSKIDWKGANSVHSKFPDEMAKRTVIRRACKNYINTSDDNDLLIEAVNRTDEAEYKTVESEVETEIENEQATEELDIEEPKEDKLSNIAKEIQEKNKAKKEEEEKKEDECLDEPGF